MNEKDVTFFSTLLNEEAGNVETFAEEGTLGEKITALNLMNQSDVESLKTNLTKQVKEDHVTEMVEEAKKGNLDKELYKVIKGATLEMTEKELAKKYSIESYDNVNDLVSKAISKNKGRTDDTKTQELAQKIIDLQGINENLVKEKDEAVTGAKNEYESKILQRDKTDMVNSIPFDFSDVEDGELDKTTLQRKQIVSSVFDSKFTLAFQDDKIVVLDKEGNLQKNPATLEPLPVSDVLKQIPIELGMKLRSLESGGQGGQSSGGNGQTKYASYDEFEAECAKRSILPTSTKGIQMWTDGRPQQ